METEKTKFTLFEKIFYTLGVISGCLFCVGILFACTLEGLCKNCGPQCSGRKVDSSFYDLVGYCISTPDWRRSNSK